RARAAGTGVDADAGAGATAPVIAPARAVASRTVRNDRAEKPGMFPSSRLARRTGALLKEGSTGGPGPALPCPPARSRRTDRIPLFRAGHSARVWQHGHR